MDTLLKIGLLVLGSFFTLLVALYMWKKTRNVNKEDARNTTSKQETDKVATTLETLRQKTAEGLEVDRKERSSELEAEQRKMVERVAELEKEVLILKTQVQPFWTVLQEKMVRDLLHPHPQFFEMDELMRQLNALTITDEGRARLGVLIEERIVSTDPAVSEDEKETARHFKWAMGKVLEEAKSVTDE
jgi:hypothetical protein